MIVDSAFILTAGLGTRLRPITDNIPKPLVKIHGKPIIQYSLELLYQYGVRNFIFNSHYLALQINQFVHENWQNKANCQVIFEPDVLETGGGIFNGLPLIPSDAFWAINGDIFWQGDDDLLQRMTQKFNAHHQNYAVLAIAPLPNIIGHNGKGDFSLNGENLLREKSDKSLLFMGVQILRKDFFKDNRPEKFSLNLIYDELLLENRLIGEVMGGKLYHIGDVATYQQVQKLNRL